MKLNSGMCFCSCLMFLLVGCASSNIHPEDMSKLGAAPTIGDIGKIAHGPPLYRLDYLVDGQAYTYEIYEATDTAKYYLLLFQGGRLVAVDIWDEQSNQSEPGTCTFFPPRSGMDVEDCLRKIDQSLMANKVDLRQPATPDQEALERSKSGAADTVGMLTIETALFAPIMVPVLVITLPIAGASALADKSPHDSPNVTLGESYEDVRSRVESYPANFVSITDGNGTVLVPGHGVSEVAAAFGVAGGKVNWINLSPGTQCSGLHSSTGTHCTMGQESHRIVKQIPRTPRPPVIDEWENIALYYSPPAHYDVLGETSSGPGGYSAKSRTENAVKDVKQRARKDGATAVLVETRDEISGEELGEEVIPAPAAGTATPVYGAVTALPFYNGWTQALEIYVPADAEAFQKAAQTHATSCAALSQKNDDMKDAYKAMKEAGTPAEIAAAEQNLQSAEDAYDAAFCGDDDWYAEQMTAQKH